MLSLILFSLQFGSISLSSSFCKGWRFNGTFGIESLSYFKYCPGSPNGMPRRIKAFICYLPCLFSIPVAIKLPTLAAALGRKPLIVMHAVVCMAHKFMCVCVCVCGCNLFSQGWGGWQSRLPMKQRQLYVIGRALDDIYLPLRNKLCCYNCRRWHDIFPSNLNRITHLVCKHISIK
jgi:hypothetical protein